MGGSPTDGKKEDFFKIRTVVGRRRFSIADLLFLLGLQQGIFNLNFFGKKNEKERRRFDNFPSYSLLPSETPEFTTIDVSVLNTFLSVSRNWLWRYVPAPTHDIQTLH